MVGVVSRKSFKTCISRLFTAFLISVLFLHRTIFALDPHKSLTQDRLDVWKENPGLPQSVVTDILRTRDGYIWLATGGGLVRFDGVRFTRFDKGHANQLKDNETQKLLEDREGNLWIATYGGGLSRLKDGNFTTYTKKDGLANDFITSIFEDSRGSLWITTEGGLTRWKDHKFNTILASSLSDQTIQEDQKGNLWLVGENCLYQLHEETVISFTTK